MIGSAVGLDFMSFIYNLTGISVLIYIATIALLVLIYRKDLHTTPELQAEIMKHDPKKQIKNPALLRKCLFVLAITVSLFVLHSVLHLETATAALSGAGLLLFISYTRDEGMISKVLSKVEWTAIFFFAGLFVLVGALVETGVIKALATEAMKITQGNVDRLTSDPDREIRREAWENYADSYLAYKNTLTSNLATSMRTSVFNMRARRASSCKKRSSACSAKR